MSNSAPLPSPDRHVARASIWLVFVPFASGYFFSFMLRNINAVAFPELVTAFGLGPDALGVLTSAYFFGFAAFQIPLGLLLDRYGPRRVNASLLLVAGFGTLLFALAPNFPALVAARALMGLGFSGCLMSSMAAFIIWFARARMATLSGWMLAVGAFGALCGTQPVEMILRIVDWRSLFGALAALVIAASLIIFLQVPEHANKPARLSLGEQFQGVFRIFTDRTFWRIGLLAAFVQAGGLALLGLWAGPWLRDVGALERAAIGQHLAAAAIAFGAGGIAFGTVSDRLLRRGLAPELTYFAGCAATALLLVPLALGTASASLLLWSAFAACAASGTLAYPLLTARFPAEMAGRVLTAVNVLTMACSFVFQAGVGAVIGLWPVADGHYALAGYRTAFGLVFALQLAALVWAVWRHAGARPRPV